MLRQAFNEIFYPLRQVNLPWRLSPYHEQNSSGFRPPYFPDELNKAVEERTLRVAAFYAWLLEQVPWPDFKQPLELVDIGSKNFFYVAALYYVLSKKCPDLRVQGLEVDIGRRYTDLYRRKDYARYYVNQLNKLVGREVAFYQQANWLTYNWPETPADRLITNFFPFLFDDLSQGWGLPQRFFKPKKHLEKMISSSDYLFLAHQGEQEAIASNNLLKQLNAQILWQGSFQENEFVERKFPVHLLFCKGQYAR